MRPKFDEVAGLWQGDGSLRDIYVQNTDSVYWRRFDQLLSHYEFSYTFEGLVAPFPGSHSVLENREGSHVLSIFLNVPVQICCHFFIAEQLELDISPKEALIYSPSEKSPPLKSTTYLAISGGKPN